MTDRDEAIAAIKAALKRRSGRPWSVTGGRGTACGWIRIYVPPARRTAHAVLKAGATDTRPENYETIDTGQPGGYMTDKDRTDLGALLSLDPVHCQGVSIPASSDHRREYIDRAEGRPPSVVGKQYWD